MRSSSILISSFLLSSLLFPFTNAINFYIENKCSYTVWAAAWPGGGQQLDPGQTWTLVDTDPTNIWGRTNCSFDESGQGSCLTGDCNGRLECQSQGAPPYTLAKYGSDVFDEGRENFFISLKHGFNVPMEFRPTDPDQCTVDVVSCTADINGECPNELKAPGGCDDPCTVFNTEEYCCNDIKATCEATDYSKFFKDQCPDAYTNPEDDVSSCFEFTTDYRVAFCP